MFRLGRDRGIKADLILWNCYRIELVTELERLSAEDKEKAIIEGLLNPQAVGKTWEALYEAEQRLAFKWDDDTVKADWARRFIEAQNLGMKSADALLAQFNDPVATPGTRKAAFLKLLKELHFQYSKRRLDRKKRKEAATWLNYCGLALAGIGIVVTVAAWKCSSSLGSFVAQAHLFYAVWFGVLGAYLSRSVSMRSTVASLDYELLISDYSNWTVIQRLIIGGIAALVMYFLIAGGLLAGDLFPTPIYADALLSTKSGETILSIPSAGFAKLLIWSVIAGFSERLLPDQLSRLENAARDGGKDKEGS